MTAAIQVYEGEGKLARRSKPRVPKEEHLPPGQFQRLGIHTNLPGECSYCYDTVHRYYFISRRQAVRACGEEAVAQGELNAIQSTWYDLRRKDQRPSPFKNDPTWVSLYPWTVEAMVWWNKVNCDRNMWTREGERERRGH